MYSISSFGSMITDKGRMDPYVTALQNAVRPDSIVMDIGTGTGIGTGTTEDPKKGKQ